MSGTLPGHERSPHPRAGQRDDADEHPARRIDPIQVVELERGYVETTAPFEGNGNHLGTMYAGVLFTVAEVIGGVMAAVTFDMTKVVPLVKSMEIDFKRPARSDVVARGAPRRRDDRGRHRRRGVRGQGSLRAARDDHRPGGHPGRDHRRPVPGPPAPMSAFQLAQTNLGRVAAPLDSPQLQPFMDALESVNANADGAPGFVWRLQTEEGDATALTVFNGALMVNLSGPGVARGPARVRLPQPRPPAHHAPPPRVLREDRPRQRAVVVAGHVPTLAELEERYAHLREHGPTPFAFSFQRHYPPPDADAVEALDDDRDLCPA